MVMKSFPDAQLKFGELAAAGTFANVINMEAGDARRMRVVISGGKDGVFTLKAGTNGSTFGTTLGSATATDKGAEIYIPESVIDTPYLQLSCTGTLASNAVAYIDTYMGI